MKTKNLPAITARYWAAILAASMCGANTGDFLSRILHLGHTRGLLPLAVVFLLVIWAEKRSQRATEAYYWLAIIVLRTGATNLADLATHDLQLGYGPTLAGLAALLVAIVMLDRGASTATSPAGAAIVGRRQTMPAATALYWAAMLTAGTLGTAAGDFVADEIGLGVGLGSVVLVAIFVAVLVTSERIGGMTKPWYWLTIVAARTAGTTLGDFVASRHGLNLGLTLSTICTSCLLAGIVFLWRDKPLAMREA